MSPAKCQKAASHSLKRTRDRAHSQRVVAAQRDRQHTFLRVFANNLRDRLAHFRDSPRVLEFANGRVRTHRRGYVLELMMAIKVDLPAEFFKLFWEAGFYEVDGALVDTGSRLVQSVS